MLHRQHLISELERRREDFVSFEREWRLSVAAGAAALRELGAGGSSAQVQSDVVGARWPGAMPSEELDAAGAVVLNFGERWDSHEEARRWALGVLAGRTTFAADGSQLLPGREVSMPVAGVQIGWFENPHTPDGLSYTKNSRFFVITPRELLEAEGGAANAGAYVNLRRFEAEVEAACAFLRSKRGWRERGERVPVAFFDGMLLLVSARGKVSTEEQATDDEATDAGAAAVVPDARFPEAYVSATAKLIRLSRETEVPVVGYIDQSYARDLVRLLDTLAARGSSRSNGIYDTQLLRVDDDEEEPPLLSSWGDRTIFFYCLREGLTEEFRGAGDDELPPVGFVYLQTTSDAAPARLDLPAWIYEAGLLEEVLDAVRAECVVGNGYPYPLEAADQTAVIGGRDREQFLRAMQDFSARESFAFRVSRKAVSKARRR